MKKFEIPELDIFQLQTEKITESVGLGGGAVGGGDGDNPGGEIE